MSKAGVLHLAKYSRDVETVKKYARCCIYITSDGVRVEENQHYRIEILAVIGQYQDDRLNLDEAVLLEVGLSRGKPYQEATGLKDGNPNYPKNYPCRHPYLSITAEQYQLVAPEIFNYLVEYSINKVSLWKNDWFDPWWIKIDVGTHKNRFSGLTKDHKWLAARPAIRFAVSVHDNFLVSDIYWAELYGKDNLQEDLKKILKFIGDNLGGYKMRDRKRFPSNWMKFPRFAAAISSLKRLPKYVQFFIWKKHFPINQYFHYEIMEQIGFQGIDCWEEVCAQNVLDNPSNRIGDVSIRIVRKSDRFVVFEILPPPPKVEYEDEIPF